ncbi:MAG: nucleolar DEAD-box protein required for synthesis of 60S ribosomal subunit [Piccolia ochrophora]|nr:MAG: nucleolar DEAD-box protein required for synthesis of 60S ribosomal subunit [Piccolia ochrophora]
MTLQLQYEIAMAPIQLEDRREIDDFLLTISDNEDDVPNSDDADSAPSSPPPAPTKPPKRKREQDGGATQDIGFGQSKKAKKSRKNPGLAGSSNGLSAKKSNNAGGDGDGDMDPDFEFQPGDVGITTIAEFDGWGMAGHEKQTNGTGGDGTAVDIDQIIARRRAKGASEPSSGEQQLRAPSIEADLDEDQSSEGNLAVSDDQDDELLAEDGFGMGAALEDEESHSEGVDLDSDGGMRDEAASDDDNSAASPVAHPDDISPAGSESEGEKDDPAELARQKAFFAPEEVLDVQTQKSRANSKGSFQHMSLSRPILRGLAAVGFSEPTPIQVKTIPVALLGKDVVGGAVTGSGKTAAFLVPIFERLLYRPKKVPISRVAILMPTRELAVQCHNVAQKLAVYTDITFCRLVGGFSIREQEANLRMRPDVIIATPGRFIDHMRNSASFMVDTLEILVLDEADRMLEDGFADELNEILTSIPKSRQTMLFSATMTDTVDKLIRVGLNRPVRLLVDAKKQTVGTLTQEFVRLRPGREEKRLGYLVVLCQTIFTDRVIVFFRQKKEAHRVRIIFALLGIKAAELHGSMSQEQRLQAVESFRTSSATHLLATDLASRGLDIKSTLTVINYETPQTHSLYLHRIGRTARAGRPGTSCTLTTSADRKLVRDAVKAARAQGAKVTSRIVDPAAADSAMERLDALEADVEEVLKEEKEEKALNLAEREVKKGENVVRYADEIKARPKRTWFANEKEKVAAKDAGRKELNGELGAGKKKDKGRLSGKEKKKMDARVERRKDDGGWKKGKGVREGGEGRKDVGGGGKKTKAASSVKTKRPKRR